MNAIATKLLVAIIVGSACMMAIDFGLAHITNSMLTIPAAVLLGGAVAGYLYNQNNWLPGLLIGLINSVIAVLLVYVVNPEIIKGDSNVTLDNVLLVPIGSSIIFGVIGSVIGHAAKHKISNEKGANA